MPPLLALLAAMLVFTAVFFYATPRTGGANWESGTGVRNMVGFSPEVSFEDMGELLLSKARVMRVSFSNVKTGEVYTVIGEPYFRGTVLTKYLTAGGHGQWRQEVESGDVGRHHVVAPAGRARSGAPGCVARADRWLAAVQLVSGLRHRRDAGIVADRAAHAPALPRRLLAARLARRVPLCSVATTAFRYGAQFHGGSASQPARHTAGRADAAGTA